jgi:hypothetical protein
MMAFDQAIADEVCERIATGNESLRAICASLGFSHCTWLNWVREDATLANQYARANEIGAACQFESLEELSDEPPERDQYGKVDPGWVAWQRGRIDTRKWTLARKQPKKYGDKLAIGGADDLPPIKTMPDEALAARIKALQDKVNGE